MTAWKAETIFILQRRKTEDKKAYILSKDILH